MSGPKCVGYSVDPAVIRERRRRDTAMARRSRLLGRFEALEAAAPPLPGGYWQNPSTETVEEWNRAAEARLREAEAEQTAAEQRERDQEIRDEIAEAAAERARAEADGRTVRRMTRRTVEEVASGRSARAVRIRAAAAAERARAVRPSTSDGADADRGAQHSEIAREGAPNDLGDRGRSRRDDRISALAGTVPADATAEEHRALRHRLVGLAAASPSEFEPLLVTAESEMQRVKRAAADRAESRRRAERLLQSLDGLDGTEIDACRRLLDRAVAGRTVLLDSDAARVERARIAAAADSERRFVASRIADAFRESGIEVGDGFVTDVVAGNEAYAAARSSEDHAVGVRMERGRVDLRVVRSEGDPDAGLDTQAEHEFCKDFGDVSASLHRRGVQLDLISHRRPGEVEMATVPGIRPASASRRRRRSRPKERARRR